MLMLDERPVATNTAMAAIGGVPISRLMRICQVGYLRSAKSARRSVMPIQDARFSALPFMYTIFRLRSSTPGLP